MRSYSFLLNTGDRKTWATGESEHFVAVAEYPFEPMGDRELELKPGQVVRLAPSKLQPADVRGWVLASDGFKIGLIPTNYIKIKGKRSRDPFPLARSQQTLPVTQSVMASPERRLMDSILQETGKEGTSNNCADAMSSDDDTDTLVGDSIDED